MRYPANFGAIDGKTANGLVRHSEKYEAASLPATGASSSLAGVGAALVAVGGALLALRHRGTAPPALIPIVTPDPGTANPEMESPMNIGPTELIVVLAVVLLIFGGTKIPHLARSLGQAQKEFRKGTDDVGEHA